MIVPEPDNARRGVVIGWMPHSRRSETLARRLGLELRLLARPGFRRPATAPLGYVLLALRSLRILVRQRGRAIIVVAPPITAPLVVVPIGRLLGARVAIDVHSGALLDRRWRWSLPLLRALVRLAGTAIVTLPSLADRIRLHRRMLVVLPDPLPDLAGAAPTGVSGTPCVVAICGWGDDEPVDALIAAAEGRAWKLVVTGRPRRTLRLPANVSLSGFLPDDAYTSLLAGADVIVVLTTREDTLLSGIWEALALRRPIVTSDTRALVMTFGDGLRYASGEASSIGSAIDAALADPAAAEASARVAAVFQSANDRALVELATRLRLEGSPGQDAALA